MIRSFIWIALLGCGDHGGGKIDAPGSSDATKHDARVDGPTSTIDAAVAIGPACGATTCTNGVDDCCLGGNPVCVATGTCPTQGFTCDGPEDCPGAACCYGNGGTGGSQCKASCSASACHADTDCPQATPKCCPKSFTPGYDVCQAHC